MRLILLSRAKEKTRNWITKKTNFEWPWWNNISPSHSLVKNCEFWKSRRWRFKDFFVPDFFYKPQGNDSYLNPPPTCSAFSKIERNYGFELSLEHNNGILVFNSFKVNPIWMINIGIIEMKSFLKWCFSANQHQRKINCKFRLRDSLLSPRWRQICTYYRGTKWDFNLVSI